MQTFLGQGLNPNYSSDSGPQQWQSLILNYWATEELWLIRTFLFGCACNMWKFLGQGSGPSCSRDLYHSCRNTGSFNHCTGPGIKPHLHSDPSHCSQIHFHISDIIQYLYNLSFSILFHLAQCSPNPSMLLQMAKFHSFFGWTICCCVCVYVYITFSLSIHLLIDT